jgi:hypothetical protein
VLSSTGKPLMPCHPARVRELVRKGRALCRFSKGLFYLRLLDRAEGAIQPVACGIDPGSKQEGLTVKSEAHTFLNLQADAVTWVKEALKTRREMRCGRRLRKTPCRQPRFNRARGNIPPSSSLAVEAQNCSLAFEALSNFGLRRRGREGQDKRSTAVGCKFLSAFVRWNTQPRIQARIAG